MSEYMYFHYWLQNLSEMKHLKTVSSNGSPWCSFAAQRDIWKVSEKHFLQYVSMSINPVERPQLLKKML